ncbi:MAG: 50S ribosomal protein L3 [Candidatus Sungiibacteriota bacterium]
MMKFLLGEKIGMSQLFDAEGRVIPVTMVRVPANTVLMVRTQERDGYAAIQVGMGERKAKQIRKAQKAHFDDFGNFRYVREFRMNNIEDGVLARGERIAASIFQEGDMVKVSGISKAKGFQGVVKRHGFHGAPATHGTKHAHREPGSIGGGGGRAGGRVAKGIKMGGRMGGDRVSVKNLKIVRVDVAETLIAVSGAVPGRRGTLLEIRG